MNRFPRRLLPFSLASLTLLLFHPSSPAADPRRPSVRLVDPRPGVVRDVKQARLAGKATVNFGELAKKGGGTGLARPLLVPEAGDDPLEPLSALAPGGVQAPQSPLVSSPSPTTSFMGLNDIPMVDSLYIIIPPDVGGAVGPNRVMDGHNNNYRVLNKADGTVISTVGTATFWAPSGETALNGLTDPRTVYDPYNNRWLAVMQTVTSGAGDILVGVSQTSDPNGSWFLYRFAAGATIDFPILGFNKNWITVSINRYSNAGLFQRGITLIVNYPQAMAGTGSGVIVTQASGTHFCTAPCATYSATEDTLFLVTHLSSTGATYALDTITGTPSLPVYTAGGTLTRPGGGWVQPSGQLLPQSAPNSGTSACTPPCVIETQDAQVRSAPVFRGGVIYYTQTIGLPSTGLAHTSVQWTEIGAPGGAFLDGGRIDDATATASNGGKWYAYPHIAVNSSGDYMIGYSQFSSAQHPSAGYSMHLAGDAAGTVRDPVIYKAGEDYYHKTFGAGRNRWGDFSAAQVDPTDDRTLWTLQEYAKNRVNTDDGNTGSNGSRWSTWWAAVGPAQPSVNIAAGPSLNEGNSGLTPFTFTVNLSSPAVAPVSVNYQTADGTATVANNDYQAASGVLTIPVGGTSGTIPVNVVGDTVVEPNETFTVTISNPVNAVLGPSVTSTGTIINDDTYTITPLAGANGSISPSTPVSVVPGGSVTFNILPNNCYHVADVLVDGGSVGAVASYTFTAVAANHTISASFAINSFTISASAGSGGTISPSGGVSVNCGASQSFSILPDGLHTIADVLVDGGSVGAVSSYTFPSVTGAHTIAASFALASVVSSANIPYAGMSPGGVNMATGEIIIVCRPDLRLEGPMPLEYGRYYGSMLAGEGLTAGPLGPNWLGTYDWSLSVSGPGVRIATNRGQRIQFVQNASGGYDLASPLDVEYRLDVAGGSFRYTDPSRREILYFDGTTHLLTQIQDERGNALNLTYAAGLLSQVSDGLGRALSFTYDGLGHLTQVGDGTRSVGFAYSAGLLATATDAGGHPWSYSYQVGGPIAGLLTSVTEPLTNVPAVQSFDASGRIQTQTDAFGHASNYVFGLPSGNTFTDGRGGVWTYLHDAQDRLMSLTDPATDPTSFSYDASGRLSGVQRPLGDPTSIAYDPASGYPSTLTFQDGSAIHWGYGSHLVGGATLFDLSTASYPDGTNEGYTRDAAGNLTDFRDRGGFHWQGTYNGRGQLLTATNPSTGLTTLSYDNQGRPATEQDNAGNTTQYGYDGLGRVQLVTWPDLTTRHLVFDALDHPTGVTDERSKAWSYGYDADGRLVSTSDPLQQTTNWSYDAMDRVTQVTDALGHGPGYAYDQAGRLASITDGSGRTTSFGRDLVGRITGIQDPAGGTDQYGYDSDSRVTSMQDPMGHLTLLGYNLLDRLTSVQDPVGTTFNYGYDAMGRLTSSSGPLGHSETYSYDPRGLLSSYFDTASETDLPRTPLGEVAQLTDPDRNAWPRTYDKQGRLTGTADPLTRAYSYQYDPLSRPVHVGRPDGSIQQISYDAAGRITGTSYTDGTTLGFGYDDAGRLTSGTGASFAYDAAGHMTGSNGFSMTYDGAGRILSETLAPGKVVTYSYDSRGLLLQASDWMGGTTGFQYDTARRLTGITRPDGTAAAYQYDAAGRLTSAVESKPGPIQISSIAITRDALGRATSIDRREPLMPGVTSAGTTGLTYDAASQLNGTTHDALGRMLGDGSRTLTWDGASRLKRYAALADSPSFAYDAFGQPTSSSLGTQTVQQAWNYAHRVPTVDDMQVNDVTPRLRYFVRTPSGLLLYGVDGSTGARRFYHFDEAGNTSYLTNDSGSVVAEYSYGPFGGVTGTGETADNPFTFGAAAGMMSLGQSGLWAGSGLVYDDRTMRVISGNATRSGADLVPLLLPGAEKSSPWNTHRESEGDAPTLEFVAGEPGRDRGSAPGSHVMIVPPWPWYPPGPPNHPPGLSALLPGGEDIGTLTTGANHLGGGQFAGGYDDPVHAVDVQPGPQLPPGASVGIVPHWPLAQPGPISSGASAFFRSVGGLPTDLSSVEYQEGGIAGVVLGRPPNPNGPGSTVMIVPPWPWKQPGPPNRPPSPNAPGSAVMIVPPWPWRNPGPPNQPLSQFSPGDDVSIVPPWPWTKPGPIQIGDWLTP